MLQAIRERVTGIVAIFVLGLLAVPFLFFGVESYMRAVPQDAVATVGDDEIPPPNSRPVLPAIVRNCVISSAMTMMKSPPISQWCGVNTLMA
jgi:hypothetical protein